MPLPSRLKGIRYHPDPDNFTPIITGADIRELRRERGENQAEFGYSLKRAIDSKTREGFAKEYISMLESGKKPVTLDIETGFFRLAGALDDAPVQLAGKVRITVLANREQIPADAILTEGATADKCKCGAWFIRVHPFQRYCSERCPARPENKR
jgi:hypothetical protein